MNRQTVAKAHNRALDRLGYKHVKGTHMLRKTSATLANEETGDFYAVSKLMDHYAESRIMPNGSPLAG
jgi:integrase